MKNIKLIKLKNIKCDSCDFKNKNTIKNEDLSYWLNKPCPKCRKNLLTKADFDTIKNLIEFEKIINNNKFTKVIMWCFIKLFPGKRAVNMDGSGKLKL